MGGKLVCCGMKKDQGANLDSKDLRTIKPGQKPPQDDNNIMKLPEPKGHLEALYRKDMFFTWPLGVKHRHSMIKLSEEGNIFIDEQ